MRIKDLATRTAKLITGNAYFGVDNGANEVRKIDYKELAKQIIEEYNLSTLAGSAQSVQGALNALNSNLWKTVPVGSYTDFNDFPDGTEIWANNSSGRFTHAPSQSAFHVFTMLSITGYKYQRALQFQGNYEFVRTSIDGTWGEWVQFPTRAEITSLNNSLGNFHMVETSYITAGNSYTFTIPIRAVCLLVTSGQALNLGNLWIVTSGGVSANAPLKITSNEHPNVVLSSSNALQVIVTNSHPSQGVRATLYCLQHG